MPGGLLVGAGRVAGLDRTVHNGSTRVSQQRWWLRAGHVGDALPTRPPIAGLWWQASQAPRTGRWTPVPGLALTSPAAFVPRSRFAVLAPGQTRASGGAVCDSLSPADVNEPGASPKPPVV